VLPQADYNWSITMAYASTTVNINDIFRAANEYLGMGQSTDVEDLLSVESTYLGIPSIHTIAGDDSGRALYADIGDTRAVTLALIAACLPPRLPQLVYEVPALATPAPPGLSQAPASSTSP
jgi:hypothetical protein